MSKCKFCDLESDDNYDCVTIPVNLGVIGKCELAIYINGLGSVMGIDFGLVGENPAVSERVPIKYCPYCGNKLGGEEYRP